MLILSTQKDCHLLHSVKLHTEIIVNYHRYSNITIPNGLKNLSPDKRSNVDAQLFGNKTIKNQYGL